MSWCKFWTAAWELRHLWWMVVLWVNLLRLSSGLRSGREVLLSDVLHDWRTTDFCDCLCQFDVDGMLEGFAWDFRNPSNSVVFEDKQLSCSQPRYFSADICQSLFTSLRDGNRPHRIVGRSSKNNEKHEKTAKLLLFTVFLRGEKQKPLQIPWFLRVRWPKTL